MFMLIFYLILQTILKYIFYQFYVILTNCIKHKYCFVFIFYDYIINKLLLLDILIIKILYILNIHKLKEAKIYIYRIHKIL